MLELFYTALMIGFGWHVAALAAGALIWIGMFVVGFVSSIVGLMREKE